MWAKSNAPLTLRVAVGMLVMVVAARVSGRHTPHARHNGHVDAVRERIDGVTGLLPSRRTDREERQMPPTMANGKICYIELPATDIDRSAQFYEGVFGWNVRRRSDGALAFDDGVGEVSGTWVTGRPPASEPGLLFYILVDSVEAAVASVVDHGGEIVQPLGADAPELTARFRDPGGNVIGLYQEPTG